MSGGGSAHREREGLQGKLAQLCVSYWTGVSKYCKYVLYVVVGRVPNC